MTGRPDKFERRAAVKEIACGECGAPAGENCRTTFGNVKHPPHKRRIDDWRRARAESESE